MALLILVAPAWAAFPGRDGLLAVEPLHGSGVVLIKANGRDERLLCQARSACALECPAFASCGDEGPLKPAWSPDGRVLAVSAQASAHVVAASAIVYPDGSCLDCAFPIAGDDVAFTSNPTLLTAVGFPTPWPYSQQGLYEFGVDGLATQMLGSDALSGPVWSSRDELAVVRGHWIAVGSPGKLHRLTRGSAPAWSPGGRKIVFDRNRWLMIGSVRDHSFRRLVRGRAPAWSPDGSWIAFIGRRHHLSLVRTSGGRVRRVGRVTGNAVDWQPLPGKPPAACQTPDSTVIASSATALLTADSAPAVAPPGGSMGLLAHAYTGCLRADGRARLLANYTFQSYDAATSATNAVLAGDYAALVVRTVDEHYGGEQDKVAVFDLRTGAQVPDRGGEESSCPGRVCIDQLVLGSDAVSAVHTNIVAGDSVTEEIVASDSTGIHTLDTNTEPSGSPTALTNLTLSGDTLTWDHDGTPRNAQLQP